MRPGSVDSNYVLHGRKTLQSQRPEYLTNSQLTTTTKELASNMGHSFNSADEYRVLRHARTRSPSPNTRKPSTSGQSPTGTGHFQPREIGDARRSSVGSLRRSVSFERLPWSVDGEDDDEDEPELQRLAGRDSPGRSDIADWCTKPVHLTNSLSPRELRHAARAASRQRSDRSDAPAASSPLPAEEQSYPITELDELARRHFPVTASSYRLEFGESPLSNSMAMSPPPKHLRAPRPHKWRIDGSVKHLGSGRRPRSAHSELAERHPVDKLYSMVTEAPSFSASTVHIMSPFQMDLARLRMERLRIEEDHLLEMKRQAEIERIRGPRPKWYESKKPDFHYEAHKNNELLANEGRWQELLDYRDSLKSASKVYGTLNA